MEQQENVVDSSSSSAVGAGSGVLSDTDSGVADIRPSGSKSRSKGGGSSGSTAVPSTSGTSGGAGASTSSTGATPKRESGVDLQNLRDHTAYEELSVIGNGECN